MVATNKTGGLEMAAEMLNMLSGTGGGGGGSGGAGKKRKKDDGVVGGGGVEEGGGRDKRHQTKIKGLDGRAG